MTDKKREALDAYYRDAESWSNDRLAALRASRRIAWLVALAAVAVAVLEALALVFLAPLKTVVPYTLLVDRQTGYVQALDPIDARRVTPDTALTQSFLVQYVIARESFDIDSLNENYRKLALWSVGTARAGYLATMQASNPASPLARYPRTTIVETSVKSVSPLRNDAALVRFETRRRDADGRVSAPGEWVAVVRYRFSAAPLSTGDRFINPLGFQVMRYDRSEEVLPATPESTPAPAPTTSLPATVTPAPGIPGTRVDR